LLLQKSAEIWLGHRSRTVGHKPPSKPEHATLMNATAPIHILIVDDEPEIRWILQRDFEAEGYDVSEAGGRSGLLRCIEQPPVSLITFDLEVDLTVEPVTDLL
jgi:PleD family two-component response regulator